LIPCWQVNEWTSSIYVSCPLGAWNWNYDYLSTIFQPNNIGTCHVIEERHGILEFWLLFNYIITNGTLKCVTWAFMVTIKLKYLTCAMCTVSKSWNYWFIENVNIWYCATWTLMLHTCMTHGILLFVSHPTYVKLSQSKEINYKVVENKLKICWK
jgi:hypothetical protein